MKIIKKAMICFCFLSSASLGASTLLYGIVAGSSSSKISQQARQKERNALQSALQQPVKFKKFATYADELRTTQEQPKLLSFVFAKEAAVPDISKLKQWKKVAQVLTMNHEAKLYIPTYSAYLIAAKDSRISKVGDLSGKKLAYYSPDSASNYIAVKNLLSDNKITDVNWVRAKNIKQAYAMVVSGKADAVGLSDYYLMNNIKKDHVKIIYEIKNLKNPSIYVNSSNLNAADIEKVTLALKKISPKTQADLTYN